MARKSGQIGGGIFVRLGGLKYLSPIRYMGTKLLANAIYSSMVVPRFSRSPRALDLSLPKPNPYLTEVRKIAAKAARPEARPLTVTPKIRPSREIPYLSKSYLSKPAAVKSNGGLRGSTATRWK